MKYTVITGASSGIGRAAAIAFAKRGSHLIVTARREKMLSKLKKELEDICPEIDVVIKPCDLSDTAQVYAFYDAIRHYDLQTLINCAGFGVSGYVWEEEIKTVEGMLRVNAEALAILSSLFARDHLMTEGAQIINISSIGGYFVAEQGVIYTSTKFFVNAFTEGLAQELISRKAKLRAKVIAPAETETEFKLHYLSIDEFDYKTNIPKYHTAEQMADFILQLYDSEYIVGRVNRDTYEFELRGPVYPYMNINPDPRD